MKTKVSYFVLFTLMLSWFTALVPTSVSASVLSVNPANAVISTVSGERVDLHDVSPTEHTMQIKVQSKNLAPDATTNLSKVTLYRHGKNLVKYPFYDTSSR